MLTRLELLELLISKCRIFQVVAFPRHKKKQPVVPVSYREKIRVSRSEIIFF